MANTELSALRALEQAIRDCGLPGAMVSGPSRLESIAAALKGVEDAREDGGTGASAEAATPWKGLTDNERDTYVGELVGYGTEFVAPLYGVVEAIERDLMQKNAVPQASQPIGQPSGYVPLSVDGKSVFIDGAGEVPLCSAECKKPVSGAGMTDEDARNKVAKALGLEAAGCTVQGKRVSFGWEYLLGLVADCVKACESSASGQAASEKAQWTLRQISQLDPQTGSIGTAVMMAKEALASTPAQQTEEKKGEQQ